MNETQSQFDYVRRRYLKELSDYTGRNTITYYSSWLTKQVNNLDINDADMTGFMTCIHGMDCSKGLDLVLHTPGGSPAAAEVNIPATMSLLSGIRKPRKVCDWSNTSLSVSTQS